MRKPKQTIAATLAKEIRNAERRGITRYQIAKLAGVSQSMMQRIAAGVNVPRLDTAEKIASAIGFHLRLLPNVVA